MPTKRRKKTEDLPMLHPDAAGIDVGASELFVAVAANRDPEPVRSYPTFTRDLLELVDWLLSCGIRSVAMESTSVYWIPVYQILEARGIEVFLVNAHYLKNVPGRKSDVSDCQSIQYLYSVGLLRASFRPPGVICAIRSLWRHRGSLIEMAAEHVMHIQKALDQMNLQIHRVLSDITGVSGLRILDARKVKILEHAETMGDWPTRFERPWQDVTRQFWTPVTLCYISIPGGSLGNRSARNHDWIQTDRILDHTTIRQECLDPMIVFGEGSLYRHLQNFINYLSPEPDAFGIGEGQPRSPCRSNRQALDGSSRFRRWVGSIIVTSGAPPERHTQLISTAAVFAPSSPCLQPRMATYPVPAGSAISSEDHRSLGSASARIGAKISGEPIPENDKSNEGRRTESPGGARRSRRPEAGAGPSARNQEVRPPDKLPTQLPTQSRVFGT